jgi:hypothetical protein
MASFGASDPLAAAMSPGVAPFSETLTTVDQRLMHS